MKFWKNIALVMIGLLIQPVLCRASVVSEGNASQLQETLTESQSADVAMNNSTAATIIVSEENPLVLDENRSVTLIAGKTITLLPGTKISAGSFMYASIATKDKNGKKGRKAAKLVTVEEHEKLTEQANLEKAASLFSPFPSAKRDHLNSSDSKNGSYSVFRHYETALTQENNTKIASLNSAKDLTWTKPTVQLMRILPEHSIHFSVCRYNLRL